MSSDESVGSEVAPEGDFRLIDKTIRQAAKLASKGVGSLRDSDPKASEAQLIKKLETGFVTTVTSSGVAAGAVAALPGAGTAMGIAAGVGDGAFFLTAATAHVLAVAAVKGIDFDNHERQRALILMVLAGGSASSTIAKAAERTGGHLGAKAAKAVPLETIKQINRVLGPNFVTRYGTRRGVIVLGKAAPFGVGAAIGGGGNFVMAKGVVKATRKAFED